MVRIFVKRAIAIGLAGVVVIVVLYSFGLIDNCSINQITVVNEQKKYQTTKDPELCVDLNDKIIELNQKCGIEMEVLDCG